MEAHDDRLSNDDIDEELVNEDLKELGVNDDLSNMDLQEKKHLLSAIKASAEPSSSRKIFDKKDNKHTPISPVPLDSVCSNSSDFTDNLESNPHLKDLCQRSKKIFCLPFCNDVDTPDLTLPEDCPIMLHKNKFGKKTGDVGYDEEVRLMIEEHDSWKKGYLKKMQVLSQMRISHKNKEAPNIIDEDGNTNMSSPKVEDDIYAFISEESCTVTSKHTDDAMHIEDHSKEVIVENVSKESFSEELFDDVIIKSPQVSSYTIPNEDSSSVSYANTRRSRNKNSTQSTVEIETNVKETLNSQTNAGETSTSRTLRTDRSRTKEKQVLETKVQCPICQQDFLQSKIENHAAECNGFCIEEITENSEIREIETVQNTRSRRGNAKRRN